MLSSIGLAGGGLLTLSRAVSVAALLSVFGALVFRVFVAPRAFARMPPDLARAIRSRLLRLSRISLAIGVAATLAWLVCEAADMAGIAALPAVMAHTDFGHLIAMQLAALAAIALAIGRHDKPRRQRVALALAALAVALQAGHSHAASMYPGPSLLLASEVLHLWGAGAWLGGLVPLLLVVRAAPPRAGAAAARWFSPLGKWCIAALTLSAGYQFWVLVMGLPGLIGTAYGLTVLVKSLLFAVLLGFAWFNRYRFAPALLASDPVVAKRILVRSLAIQTGFGLAIVAAAAVLSNLPPAMHLQPWWPIPVQFSLDAVREDPDLRLEAIGGALGLAGAFALAMLAALVRRIRWPVAALAVVAAWLSVPHLDLLLADATPTSFYRSPTDFAAAGIVAGAALFPQHCAACHGTDGRGDGPLARSLPVPPADLTAAHALMHTDGELFWWLTHGIAAPDGKLAMPGFAGILSDDERWDLIDYVRAHNFGVARAATGAWPTPLRAPDFQTACGDDVVTLQDLRGRFVRLVIGVAAAGPASGAVTVATGRGSDRTACVVDDAMVPRAYALISGIPMAGLAGTQFLIDGDGWVRAVQRKGDPGSWDDFHALDLAIDDMRAHPVAAAADHMNMPM